MKRGVNTYQGLSSDLAYDSIKKGFYIDALDIRITTDKGQSQGAITNIKGTTKFFELPNVTSEPLTDNPLSVNGIVEVIGATSIRNMVILFLADDGGENGWIYTLEYTDVDKTFLSLDLRYKNDELYFNKLHPIEAVGRFESDCIQRVYWTDYNNYSRTVNLLDDDLINLPVGLIDSFPSIKYTQPLLTKVLTGGSLLTGLCQYAYRLLTTDGKQTLISPPGKLIHTVRDTEGNRTPEYRGDLIGENTQKAHEITIDTSDYDAFESIELIYILHSDYTATPSIFSIETKLLNLTEDEVIFVHTGNEETIIELDLFEYTVKQYPFKTYKTADYIDSSLVIANIKGSQFDAQTILAELGETFEPRTGRYNSIVLDNPPVLPHPVMGSDAEVDAARLNNAFNVSTSTSDTNNGYNMDSHWDASWHTDMQYKFQENGTTLGGQGPNISYKFHLEPYLIDGEATPGFANLAGLGNVSPDLNDGYGPYVNNAADSMASPFLSGLLRGYKRGETYRFGIVFYNKKGESSFVEYIGDIKFPDISEENDTDTIPGINFHPVSRETFRTGDQVLTTAYAMGIEFNIDFDSCPNFRDRVESYQIVRVKREVNDSRRLCTGIMKTFGKHEIWTAAFGERDFEYDLRGPGGSEDILHLVPWTKGTKISGNTRDASGTITQLGCNGNFYTINDEYRLALSADGEVKTFGSFLSFYSPDISYNFPGVRSSIVQNSMMLMTGRYRDYFSYDSGDGGGELRFENNSQEDSFSFGVSQTYETGDDNGNLGNVRDYRRHMRTVGQVDKESTLNDYTQPFQIGVEYIKQLKSFNVVDFTTSNDNDIGPAFYNLGPYEGSDELGETDDSFYLRNFYIYLERVTQGVNDLEDGNGDEDGSISKGATALTGGMKIPLIDPYTINPVPYPFSSKSHFRSGLYSLSGPTGSFVKSKYEPSTTAFPIAENTDDTSKFNADLISTPILDILVPKLETLGGYTKNALTANKFIMASPVIDIVNTNPKVYGGDIFITSFTFQEKNAWINQSFFDGGAQENTGGAGGSNAEQRYTHNITMTTAMFVESRVNIELAFGYTIKTGVENDSPGGTSGNVVEWARQEGGNSTTNYGLSANMYAGAYNNAYSSEPDEIIFITKPDLDSDCAVNDVRAYISDVKINSEEIDSWTNFGIANFYDVDDHGPINKIINHKDNIYFLQDTAVGKYSINPRAITSTDDGIPTELGSSKGFQDHSYISTKYGSIHQWAVANSDSGIYYWDGIHNKIFKIAEGNAPISEMKGNHSFLKNMKGDISLRKENEGDNPILGKGVHVTKDMINNEIIFTFLGVDDLQGGKDTLVFDEAANQFSSRYSAAPSIYVENGDIILSPSPDNPDHIYQHGTGEWGNFYGTVEEAKIKLVLNEDADINKVLRFIEFNSIVRDDNKTIDRDSTITAFEVTTEYQTTGRVEFSTGRIKRKWDKWRLKIPRDTPPPNLSGLRATNRLRSTHFILTLYFDNSENKELILNRIMYYYDVQQF